MPVIFPSPSKSLETTVAVCPVSIPFPGSGLQTKTVPGVTISGLVSLGNLKISYI